MLLAATKQATGKVEDTSHLKTYMASEAYDLWSFGVVLYHLCYGTPLWKTNTDDNLNLSDLRKQAGRSIKDHISAELHVGRHNALDDLKVAADLLLKLLEPDPSARLNHFSQQRPMHKVLDHLFFHSKTNDGATLSEMLEKNTVMDSKLDTIINLSQSSGPSFITRARYAAHLV